MHAWLSKRESKSPILRPAWTTRVPKCLWAGLWHERANPIEIVVRRGLSGFLCNGGGACSTDNCPKVFAPVCGPDGETFDNACVAEAAGVTTTTEGACNARPCPRFFIPGLRCWWPDLWKCVLGWTRRGEDSARRRVRITRAELSERVSTGVRSGTATPMTTSATWTMQMWRLPMPGFVSVNSRSHPCRKELDHEINLSDLGGEIAEIVASIAWRLVNKLTRFLHD